MKKLILSLWLGGITIILLVFPAITQEKIIEKIQTPKENYLIGEEKNLEIIVHIWGEVRNSGEKRVPDGTNILELISKAGGPTEFSNLSCCLLFSDHMLRSSTAEMIQNSNNEDKFILQDREKLYKKGKVEIDINKYLKTGNAQFLPRLLPGDVVHVKRNVWHKWQTFFRVASQIAIISQVWYWYSRIY